MLESGRVCPPNVRVNVHAETLTTTVEDTLLVEATQHFGFDRIRVTFITFNILFCFIDNMLFYRTHKFENKILLFCSFFVLFLLLSEIK